MNWILVVGTAWPFTAAVTAVILGRAIRLADRRAPQASLSTSLCMTRS
jgi:hypothetical protein